MVESDYSPMEKGVSVILNCHQEGNLVLNALNCIQKNFDKLDYSLVQLELIIILDNSNYITSSIVQSYDYGIEKVIIFDTNYGNLSQARNKAISVANFDYITFLDGDDSWGSDWLLNCLTLSNKYPKESLGILHPEFRVRIFGNSSIVDRQKVNQNFDNLLLANENLWTSSIFASRHLLRNYNYKPLDFEKKIGFEDWNLNRLTVKEKVPHRIVKNTIHHVVVKELSLSSLQIMDNFMPLPMNNADIYRNSTLLCKLRMVVYMLFYRLMRDL
jgi:glycosyltransferase involved in cell wall biosynthesis